MSLITSDLRTSIQQNIPWKIINKQPTKQKNIFATSKSDKRQLYRIARKMTSNQ